MEKRFSVAMVQSGFQAKDYRTVESYYQKISVIFESFMAPGQPELGLVLFPELTGLWVPLLKEKNQKPLQALGALISGCILSFPFLIQWEEAFIVGSSCFKTRR